MQAQSTSESETVAPRVDPRTIDIAGIMDRLPHRFPFLLVDRVLDYVPGEWIETAKAVTRNEPFFEGHFPEEPLFPGVLQIEVAAQSSGLLVMLTEPDKQDLLVLGQVKRFTYISPVRPGDLLITRVESKTNRGGQGLATAELRVGDRRIAKGSLAYGVLPRPRGA